MDEWLDWIPHLQARHIWLPAHLSQHSEALSTAGASPVKSSGKPANPCVTSWARQTCEGATFLLPRACGGAGIASLAQNADTLKLTLGPMATAMPAVASAANERNAAPKTTYLDHGAPCVKTDALLAHPSFRPIFVETISLGGSSTSSSSQDSKAKLASVFSRGKTTMRSRPSFASVVAQTEQSRLLLDLGALSASMSMSMSMSPTSAGGDAGGLSLSLSLATMTARLG